MDTSLTLDDFNRCADEIISISNSLLDGWTLEQKENVDNGKYIVKKSTVSVSDPEDKEKNVIITYEYHIVFSLSYSVPIICFNVWKLDGTMICMEEYWKLNNKFDDVNLFNSLTQLDHPVLCRPFLTLHPCKTQEIIAPFLKSSKNPVISWLSVMGPSVHLKLLDEYYKHC